MKLPDRFNYAEAYLTFRCNLGCGYCINQIGEFIPRSEMGVDDWLALNDIDFGDTALTLGGGEPTQFKGFFKLVDGLRMPIDLLTNLQFNVDEFIDNVDPESFSKSEVPFHHSIRASYHAGQMDRDKTVRDAKQMRDAGFNLGVFGIRHPFNINDNMAMAFLTSQVGVPFYEKDFLGEVDGRTYGFYKYPRGLDGILKSADCRTRELLISPDGEFYRCHRDLYAGENPVGELGDEIVDEFRPCANYGECNPCDLKLKTNKYLNGVECQVEIK